MTNKTVYDYPVFKIEQKPLPQPRLGEGVCSIEYANSDLENGLYYWLISGPRSAYGWGAPFLVKPD